MRVATLGLFVLAAVVVLAVMLTGCSEPREETGPMFVALIVDSSASVSSMLPNILEYAHFALDDYARMAELHVAIINLNEKPTVEFEQRGTIYDEDVDTVLTHVKDINPDARGTDIVSAFELAAKYHSYQKIPPCAFKILCFTDGYIDPAPGGTVRQWEEFDWARFAQSKAEVGFYFVDVDPQLRDRIETACREISVSIIRNRNEAADDVRKQEPVLP